MASTYHPLHSSPHAVVSREQLLARAAEARAGLNACEMCEWKCRANRTTAQPSPCGLGADAYTFRQYISYGDEPELVPALRVYLSGCNFRCRFCNSGPTCFVPDGGQRIDPIRIAPEWQHAVDRGVRAIDLLGGEPSLHPHVILEIAAESSERPPIALDSNMYMTPRVLDWLCDVVTWIVGDFKFGNDSCADQLAGVERYWSVVTRNLLHAARGPARLMVRHLLMPGHLDCCLRPVAEWMAQNLPTTRFQLMTGYVPCWKAGYDRSVGRVNTRNEVERAIACLRELGLPTEDTRDA